MDFELPGSVFESSRAFRNPLGYCESDDFRNHEISNFLRKPLDSKPRGHPKSIFRRAAAQNQIRIFELHGAKHSPPTSFPRVTLRVDFGDF